VILTLLLAAQTAAPPPPPPEDEIVVIARKMRLIKVSMKAPKRDGRLVLTQCKVTRGSGDAELDAIPCDTAQACMESAPATRKELSACVTQQATARLNAVAAARKAKAAG
jgi:hypothetical protein